MADRLAPEDLPRIRNALLTFRDELIAHARADQPWGNFEGHRALEQALKEPAESKDVPQHLPSEMKFEPTNILTSNLPRDLRIALADVWLRRTHIDTKTRRTKLFDAY
jgi:hypothetical protein